MSQQTDAALDRLLEMAVEAGASDVHLKAGSSPKVRLRGSLAPFGSKSALSAELLKNWALTMLGKERFLKFEQDLEIDFAYQVPGVARFRVNAHHQRGAVGMVMRVVPSVVRSVVELQLPEVLHEICSEKRGLVLVTGATGSGKSTTLAAMIDHINASEPLNIVTIEDPVEFAFRDKRASIIQREVGQDTESFNRALRSALRQDPDVILIGEMRDMETVEIAMTAAETGHLVLSTLHTNGAHETINRVIGVFPPYQQESARRQLAQILRAVVSQRLVPTKDGKGRIAACEIMRASLRIKELIQDPERTHEIPESLEQTQVTLRTQTFDQALLELLKSDKITYDTALGYANSPDDLALRISGVSGAADGEFDAKTGEKPAKPNVSEHLEEDGIERFGE
ncbi:MAG: PilT/PilU family type 4a pilus ATPase [Myxococcota bacterium]|nr:PilT/PilU family type 4a pilus ATPase [Myxococcota bacterium]